MERESFVLFTSIREVISVLTLEQKGMLFQAILDYESDIEPVITDEIAKVAFIPIKQSLDRNNEAWAKEREARSQAGKKGMQSRWHNKVITDDNKDNSVINANNKNNSVISVNNKNNKLYQAITKITDNVNVNVPVNENVNVNEKRVGDKSPRFTPPTLEEIEAYCRERNNNVEPVRFFNFYESKGWMVGKNKMKDWKAAVRTWEKREDPKPKGVDDDFFMRRMGL